MKKIILVILFGILACSLIFSGCAQPAPEPAPSPSPTPAPQPAEKPIEMTFATFFPGPSGPSQVLERFCKEIEKRTEGKVKMTFYPGGSLLDAPTITEGVEKNIANIGFISIGLTPGRFPIMESFNQPVGYASAWVACHSTDDVWRKFQPEEFDNYHVLYWSNCGPQCIWSTMPINTLEDLEGKRIRAIGSAAKIMGLLGVSPVGTPTGECYDAMAKGVLDGMMFPFEAGKTWKFAEVCDYVTQMWALGLGGGFVTAVNKNSWENLPPDIQAIFDEVGIEWIEEGALTWNEIDIIGREYCNEMGVEFINPPQEETERWKEKAQPYTDEYVKSMVERGFSEKKVREVIDYFVERNEYWLQKQIEKGIKSATGPEEILNK